MAGIKRLQNYQCHVNRLSLSDKTLDSRSSNKLIYSLNYPFRVILQYPISVFIALAVGLTFSSSVTGQSLSSSLQLNPKKLTGFFFGSEAPHHEALRLTMSEFAKNADGLQLVYVASESNVAKFYELKSTDFSANPASSRGFYGFVSQTQIGKALVRNFKVSVLPTLLICNANDLVLDANGLSSLKSRIDPYAYWKALGSAGKTAASSKPVPQKKLGLDAEIEKLEIRRLQIISTINDLIYGFSVSIKSGSVDDAKALETLRVGGNRWIAYSETLSEFAGDKVKYLDEEYKDSLKLTLRVRELVAPKLIQQRKTLIDYRDRKLSIISSKRDAFNKMVDQCNELLQTVDVLGRVQSLVLIDKILADFQRIHLLPPKK